MFPQLIVWLDKVNISAHVSFIYSFIQ